MMNLTTVMMMTMMMTRRTTTTKTKMMVIRVRMLMNMEREPLKLSRNDGVFGRGNDQ